MLPISAVLWAPFCILTFIFVLTFLVLSQDGRSPDIADAFPDTLTIHVPQTILMKTADTTYRCSCADLRVTRLSNLVSSPDDDVSDLWYDGARVVALANDVTRSPTSGKMPEKISAYVAAVNTLTYAFREDQTHEYLVGCVDAVDRMYNGHASLPEEMELTHAKIHVDFEDYVAASHALWKLRTLYKNNVWDPQFVECVVNMNRLYFYENK